MEQLKGGSFFNNRKMGGLVFKLIFGPTFRGPGYLNPAGDLGGGAKFD